MANEEKSIDLYVDLPASIPRNKVAEIVSRAAHEVGLFISHIGSYSRKNIQIRFTGISSEIKKKRD